MKKPVSLRALEQRINRKLAKEDKKLCRSRRGGELWNLGRYHVIDIRRNLVVDSRIELADIVEMANDLGVMAKWEELADD